MKDIANILNNKLLKQIFDNLSDSTTQLSQCQYIAQLYAHVENAIAVLSDLKSNKSYIYNGGIAATLGISEDVSTTKIDSIWEEEILNRIHPDDLIYKHMLELQYFHFLKNIPIADRYHYHVVSNLRMRNQSNQYVTVLHRMLYIRNLPNGSIWLALCLYNFSLSAAQTTLYEGYIVNTITGQVIKSEKQENGNLLSKREMEILQLIKNGKKSREIANILSISLNTVNRHRQNILEKLRVGNSIEACRIATTLHWLPS